MLDAVMFTLFGTFTTNQTGNTVFLTLAALHRGSKKLILTATALGGFFGAGLLFGQLGAYFGACTVGAPDLPPTQLTQTQAIDAAYGSSQP